MTMPQRHHRTALVAFLLFPIYLASTQAFGGPEEVSLARANALARQKNPDVLAARADVAQAQAQLLIARQVQNPALSASTSKIPTDSGGAVTPLGNGLFDRSYDTVIAVSQLVEVGGKRKERRLSAEASLAFARARLRNAERTVSAAVARAYAGALLARETAAIARQTAESLAKSAELATARFDAGEISAADRLQIEIAAGRFRADALSAEGAARAALVGLATLLDEPADIAGLKLSDTLAGLAAQAAQAPPLLPAAGDRSPIDSRPDVESAAKGVEKADAERALQIAFRIPDPTFLVQYEREPPDRPNSVGLGVALPLPLFNRNTGAIRAAEASRDAARVELARVRARAAAELETAKLNVDTALARSRELAGNLLPKAVKVRETVAYAWTAGGASLLELLEAERSLNDVRLAAASAQADLVTAVADQRAALGLSAIAVP